MAEPTLADRVYGAAGGFAFSALWWAARLNGGADPARRGELPQMAAPCVWLHGASAGEIGAARRLAECMRARRGDFRALYTTTNAAGLQVAARALAAGDAASLAPWDAPAWVARAFDRVRPALLVLVETELWPRLVWEACRRGVPVLSASARLYDRDWPRYRLARPWIAPLLRRLVCVAAQDETQRARFVDLGARPDSCRAVGNLKYLAAAAPPPLRLPAGGPTIVVGSAHGDEIATIFRALDEVAASAPGARFVVAPRHRRDLPRAETAAARRGWRALAYSGASQCGDWRVLLLDTLGDLGAAYAAADVAVVGGAFAAHGGHNPFEAVRAGAPVLFGPHMVNFAAEAAALRAATPDACVADAQSLASRLRDWLPDAARRRRVLAAQQAALPDAAALAAAYDDALGPWFSRALCT